MVTWDHVEVCGDCLHTAANGAPDWDGYAASGHAERYRQATVANGAELVAACPCADHVAADGQCWESGVSWYACQWCGDTLGGDRFCAAVPHVEQPLTCADCGGGLMV